MIARERTVGMSTDNLLRTRGNCQKRQVWELKNIAPQDCARKGWNNPRVSLIQ